MPLGPESLVRRSWISGVVLVHMRLVLPLSTMISSRQSPVTSKDLNVVAAFFQRDYLQARFVFKPFFLQGLALFRCGSVT